MIARKMPESAALLYGVSTLTSRLLKSPNLCRGGVLKDKRLPGLAPLRHPRFPLGEASRSGHVFRSHLMKAAKLDARSACDCPEFADQFVVRAAQHEGISLCTMGGRSYCWEIASRNYQRTSILDDKRMRISNLTS